VRDKLQGDFLIIPSESMIGEQSLFLDDWVKDDLETRLRVPVFGSGYHVAEFFELVFSANER
jgi:hypothetical protein